MTTATDRTSEAIALEEEHAAHNYHPLPVVVASGEGAWVTDVDGRRYLDCLAAYSAVNFGHGNPRLVEAAREQLGRITLTSRAFHNDRLAPFVTELAALCGKDMVLTMNTSAEAVENSVTTVIESAMTGFTDLLYMESSSSTGSASVTLTFGNTIDADIAGDPAYFSLLQESASHMQMTATALAGGIAANRGI